MVSKVIGICGGSGSGKTTLAAMLSKSFGRENVALLSQDSYYMDLGHMPAKRREAVNFDHPSAIDWGLFAGDIGRLCAGEPVMVPVYDFRTHSRVSAREVLPAGIVVVEGHLILNSEVVRPRMDLKLFLDAEPDILLLRRFLRDTCERGRSVESIREQYLSTVRPMFNEFVKTSARWADMVLRAEAGPLEILEAVRAEICALTGCGKDDVESV